MTLLPRRMHLVGVHLVLLLKLGVHWLGLKIGLHALWRVKVITMNLLIIVIRILVRHHVRAHVPVHGRVHLVLLLAHGHLGLHLLLHHLLRLHLAVMSVLVV